MSGAWRVVRPVTVDEAVEALAAADPTARPHAGGTDLMVQIKEGRRAACTLVDLSRIPELRRLDWHDGALIIGSAMPMADIAAAPDVADAYPGLIDAIRVVGSVQIRNRASLGGNIANASPAADTVPVLVALDAIAHLAGTDGRRTVPVASLFTGPGRTVLAPDEIITAVEIATAPRTSSAYLRLTRRASVDLALISVAVVLADSASPRVAFGAAGPTIERSAAVEAALAEEWPHPIDDDSLGHAARVATESVRPITDLRAGERYRRAMAGVLLKRAVRSAAARADRARRRR